MLKKIGCESFYVPKWLNLYIRLFDDSILVCIAWGDSKVHPLN